MLCTTILSGDGVILWTSHTPGPPVEKLIGTKIWQWAAPLDRKQWREFVSEAWLDGETGPHKTEYHGKPHRVELKRLADSFIVAKWQRQPDVDLTAQELRVLLLVCDDLKSGEIAKRLGVSMNTLETHLTHLKKKIGANGTAGLVLWAVRCGLVAL